MIKIIFFATPQIALASFKALIDDPNFEVAALVTQEPKPSGRGKKVVHSVLAEFAHGVGIKTYEPFKIAQEPAIIEELRKIEADFFVTFAFGQILSQEILDIPKCGTVNLHASLLPKYRGANPIREALLRGDKKTGITTMLTVLELDAGDICLQKEIELDENMTSVELTEKIAALSPALIKETLLGLKCGKVKPIAQNHNEATHTRKTKKEEKIIDWSESAETIHNKIRALVDNFACQTTFGGKIIKLIKTLKYDAKGEAGAIIEVSKKGVVVGTGKGALLIETVKPEGKGEMPAYNWSLGARIEKGDKFES